MLCCWESVADVAGSVDMLVDDEPPLKGMMTGIICGPDVCEPGGLSVGFCWEAVPVLSVGCGWEPVPVLSVGWFWELVPVLSVGCCFELVPV